MDVNPLCKSSFEQHYTCQWWHNPVLDLNILHITELSIECLLCGKGTRMWTQIGKPFLKLYTLFLLLYLFLWERQLVSREYKVINGVKEGGLTERCFYVYNQLWCLLSGGVSFTLTFFVPFYWCKVCVCACRDKAGRKNWRREKRNGRTERSLPLQRACLSPPPPPSTGRECKRKKKARKERKGIWGIRGPDWVSNKYSGEQSVLTLFPSRPG